MTRSFQDWVHWLDMGTGRRWVRSAALILGVVVLSAIVAYKQFHGPLTETTLAQAVMGRQLANGHGFTTAVNFPESVAWAQAHGAKPMAKTGDAAYPFYPELHQPPLYALVIAGALKVLPVSARTALFTAMPEPPNGFRADYFLLGVNILLLWVAAAQTYGLAKTLFGVRTAVVSVVGLLLSVTVWDQAVAVNGTVVMMVVYLAIFQAIVAVQKALGDGRVPRWAAVMLGVMLGALFLGDYSAVSVIAVVAVWLGTLVRGAQRWWLYGCVAVGFGCVAGPWIGRNVLLTGSPVGLAWHGFAQKSGDTWADPVNARASFSSEAPAINLNKIANKGLTSLQKTFRERLWSGGGLVFTAFFVAGFLYRFREDGVNLTRWVFVAMTGVLVFTQAFFDSGEGEWLPVVYAVPVLIIFGAGFFMILAESNERLGANLGLACVGLLVVQAVPLVHDLAEPRRIHFSFPPYYPGLFMGMNKVVQERAGADAQWMADVPAGAAWYSGQRVWAQPATLHGLYRLRAEQNVVALVLTPMTLDRPFFSQLAQRDESETTRSSWADVYAGLLNKRFPAEFPLNRAQKIMDNTWVLLDPVMMGGK